jgi:hypothetical protein
MTFIVITILLSCLSVMAVRGHRGTWPPGMPVARPRLSAVGGTYEGSHRRPSDAYVIQERLIAAASGADSGTGGGADGHTSAALALGAVVAARPHYTGAREVDMNGWAQAVHHSVRTASLRDPATSGLVSTLDLIILDPEGDPCLRFAHVGDGAIWHCAKSEPPLDRVFDEMAAVEPKDDATVVIADFVTT